MFQNCSGRGSSAWIHLKTAGYKVFNLSGEFEVLGKLEIRIASLLQQLFTGVGGSEGNSSSYEGVKKNA